MSTFSRFFDLIPVVSTKTDVHTACKPKSSTKISKPRNDEPEVDPRVVTPSGSVHPHVSSCTPFAKRQLSERCLKVNIHQQTLSHNCKVNWKGNVVGSPLVC